MLTLPYKKENIQKFVDSYFLTTSSILEFYHINMDDINCDHIGCLSHNPQEFEEITKELSLYTRLINETKLHNRRIRVFKLNEQINTKFILPKIELFEPKPDINPKQLRFGIEHIAFQVKSWDAFNQKYKNKLPIIKEGSIDKSLFIKTEVLNTIEIEFRNDKLGE